MSNIESLRKKANHLTSLVPQQTIRDLDFEERLAHLSPRQMAREGAQLGLDALLELMKRQGRMSLDDLLMASKAIAQYSRIITNARPADDEEEGETELVTIDTRDLSSGRLAKLKAFALEMKEEDRGDDE